MKSELERIRAALDLAKKALEFTYQVGTLKNIEAILNPVEYEDVPVERWALHDKHGNFICTCEFEPSLNEGEQSIRLPYTVRREKRVPKERSVTLEGCKVERHGGLFPPEGTPSFRVFDGYPETYNKTGTVTFTWQEEP